MKIQSCLPLDLLLSYIRDSSHTRWADTQREGGWNRSSQSLRGKLRSRCNGVFKELICDGNRVEKDMNVRDEIKHRANIKVVPGKQKKRLTHTAGSYMEIRQETTGQNINSAFFNWWRREWVDACTIWIRWGILQFIRILSWFNFMYQLVYFPIKCINCFFIHNIQRLSFVCRKKPLLPQDSFSSCSGAFEHKTWNSS